MQLLPPHTLVNACGCVVGNLRLFQASKALVLQRLAALHAAINAAAAGCFRSKRRSARLHALQAGLRLARYKPRAEACSAACGCIRGEPCCLDACIAASLSGCSGGDVATVQALLLHVRVCVARQALLEDIVTLRCIAAEVARRLIIRSNVAAVAAGPLRGVADLQGLCVEARKAAARRRALRAGVAGAHIPVAFLRGARKACADIWLAVSPHAGAVHAGRAALVVQNAIKAAASRRQTQANSRAVQEWS